MRLKDLQWALDQGIVKDYEWAQWGSNLNAEMHNFVFEMNGVPLIGCNCQ